MSRYWIHQRFVRSVSRLLLLCLLATLLPFGGLTLQPEGAQAQPADPPIYICASLYTGAVRYVTNPTKCSSGEVLVNLNGETPVTLCANPYTGQLRYRFGRPCTSTETSLTLPGEQATTLCVNPYTGQISYRASGVCPAGTSPIVVPQSNEAPTDIALDNATIEENSPTGALVGTLTATDPDPGDTFTYSLLDNAGGRFQIAGDELQVANGTLLDFETDTSHDVTIQVADQDGGTYSELFTITITDANDPPTAISLGNATLPENAGVDFPIGDLSTTDQDVGDTFTYTLVAGTGDDDNAGFEVDGDRLDTAANFDFETQNSFSIRVRSTDSGGASVEQVFTITVTDVNEDPTAIGLDNQTVAEDEPVGTTVGSFTTTDPDLSDSFTYALVAGAGDTDNGSFQIVGDELQTNAVFDFEGQNSFSIRVRSTDSGGAFVEATFTITVTDANEPPTDIALSNNTVAENQAAGTAVGTFTATDQDAGETFSYALVAGTGDDDNASFQIAGDELQTNAIFDFEGQNSFSIRVRVTDSGGATFDEVFTITVTDANEAPLIENQSFGVAENSANATVVGMVAATDPDAGQSLTYTITAGNTGGTFAIDASSGQITVANNAALDFETNPSFALTVEVTDDGAPNLSAAATITINLTNVNESPVAVDQSFSVDENSPNGTLVGAVVASDPDAGQNLTFVITGGNSGNTFAIDPDSGQITVANNALLDFETSPSFSLTVQIMDNGVPALTVDVTITVNLNDVNEAPTVDDDSFSVPENSPNGTSVGTVAASDPDTGQALTFSITAGNGTGGGAFAIDANSGEITVNDSAQLDFETTPSFSLTVQVQDNGTGTLTDTATITINLIDANDPPTVADQSFNIDENSANSTPVGTVVASDPDAPAQDLTYAITGGNTGDTFAINPNTGQITVADNTALDFETNPVFSLIVEVTDNGAPAASDTATVTINLNDINEAPVVDAQNFDVPENSIVGFVVGTIAATDPDTGQSLTYAITGGNTGTTFAIDANTGQITVANNALLDFEAGNPPFSLTVEVTDNGAPPLSDTATVTITIINVNEEPTDIQLSDTDIEENSAVGIFIGTLTASDPDAGDTFTFTIQSDPDGKFQIAGDQLQVGGALDFEADASHDVTIRVTDAGGLFYDELFTITVIDVNEAPLAVQDNYNAYTHTELAAGGLSITGLAGITSATNTLTNDSDPDTNPAFNMIDIDPATGTSTNGGTFSINASGQFTYTPAADFTGVDTFTYTLRDNGPSGGLTATGTVQITVAGTKVWYVDTSEGANGTGTSTDPFNVINSATLNGGSDVDAAGEIIYVATGGANSGALGLEAGQQLIGEGVALVVTFQATPTTIAPAGTRPTMGTLTLSTNNTARGFNVNAATGVTGADVDTLTLNNVGITSTAGSALNIAGGTAGMTVSIDSLVANSGTNPGVQATGNTMGTLVITGSANTITSTTGTALNVANTTIGSGGLNFLSINSNGGVNGIVLNTTGATAGLTVSGTGTTDGSGGTIQSKTGVGVLLTSTFNVNLANMNVQNGGDDGIRGTSVNNLTLNNCNLTTNGNATQENGLQLGEASGTIVGITGTLTLTNTNINGSAGNNVHIRNTSGTLASMSITGGTFNDINDVTGANSFLFEMSGTAVTTAATMSGVTFANNSPQRALEVQVHDDGTISDFTVTGSTFNNNGIHASFTQDTTGDLTFSMLNNTSMLNANPLHAINVFASSTSTGGTITGTIQGNTIGNAGVAGSGSLQGNGIRVVIQGRTSSTLRIDGNTIRQVGFDGGARGMDLQFLGDLTSGLGNVSTNDVTITNNNVQTDSPDGEFPLAAIFLSADNQGSPTTVRANISDNTVPTSGSWDYPTFDGNGAQLVFEELEGATAQLVGTAANATTQLDNTNTGSVYANAGVAIIAGPINTPS